MAAKLRKGDKVVVIAGKDKGREGEITRVIPKDNKAVVSGVNVAIRHTKQSAQGAGRPHRQGDADRALEPGARRRQRQADPRRLPHGRRQEGALRQDHRGGDLMLDETSYVPRLRAQYRDTIRAALKEEFSYKNDMQIPRLDKIVLNMGVGEAVSDTKKVRAAAEDLTLIAGQKVGGHQGQDLDRRLQAPRADADRRQGDAAPRPDVRVPRPSGHRGAAARPRLPRRRTRRASTGAATTRWG